MSPWKLNLPRLVRDATPTVADEDSTESRPSATTSPTLRASPIPFTLAPGPSGQKSFVVTFSQKSSNIRVVHKIVEKLEQLGVSREQIFYQPDISLVDQENHWMSQWLYAQRHSKVVVCMLSSNYLKSKPCCTEWKLVPEWQRLVVGVDPPGELLKTDILAFNGPPLVYIQCQEQMLDARSFSAAQIAIKIMEKYDLNKEKSHAYELRRGSPSEDEISSGTDSAVAAAHEATDSVNSSPVFLPQETPEKVERRLSIPKLLKTPPLKFLIPTSPTESKGENHDSPPQIAKKKPSPSPSPSRDPSSLTPQIGGLDSLRLTPSRHSQTVRDKGSWF